MEHSHSSYHHDIPELSSTKILKLVSGGDLLSYTCNGARKTRSIIVEQVHKAADDLDKDDSDDIHVLEVGC